MGNKQIHFLAAVCLLLSAGYIVYPQTKAVSLGGRAGWPELSVSRNITRGTGRFGYESLQIAHDERAVTALTDLLLSFEDGTARDSAGKYELVTDSMMTTSQAAMGKLSGLSAGKKEGIVLRGGPSALFGSAGNVDSFTIEYWLSPSLAENGEMFFSWRSSRNVNAYSMYQMITALFVNGRLEWKFSNVFSLPSSASSDITLTSRRVLVPDVWTHHSITYDADSSLLEYRIDGSVEAVAYATSTKTGTGTPLHAVLGVPSVIEICPSFIGSIDDFRIVRDTIDTDKPYGRYKTDGARFETMPIPAAGRGSSLVSIDAVADVYPQNDVVFFVRAGDNYFEWTDTEPAWQAVSLNTAIHEISGSYFQIACDMYSDGLGKTTPSVTEIIVRYIDKQPPLPPYAVNAESGDKSVTVSWSQSADENTAGYVVYYGERPGEYLGRIASQGPSPINVGNVTSVTVGGLENGKLYYFAVAAYSDPAKKIQGVLSREVYARPLRKK